MRLLTKISIVYLLITTLVLLVGSVITFETVQQEVDTEHRRFLREQLDNIKISLESGSPASVLENDKIRIRELGSTGDEKQIVFSDTVVLHKYTQRMESNQKLETVVKVNDRYYSISIHDIIVEPDDIVDAVRASIWKIFVILLVVFAIVSVLLPWLMLRPFDATLDAIRKFSLKEPGAIKLGESTTKEFSRLNNFILEMTSKSRSDYQSLKEFTENASHELQTPLAVSRGKLDLLMQSPNLGADDLELVNDAQNSIMKLSRLSRSLSLLTRIENQEFTDATEVEFGKLAKEILEGLNDFVKLHDLTIEVDQKGELKTRMDPILAEILINNLIQNAIRHNQPKGWIHYQVNTNSLVISNTGPKPALPPVELFERFKKGGNHRDSIGLGLAIVKQICDLNSLTVSYDYEDEVHTITIAKR